MRTHLLNNNQFIDNNSANRDAALVKTSMTDITAALYSPGLINPTDVVLSYPGTNTIDLNAPLPFRVLFGSGVLASSNGTINGQRASNASVDFSGVIPSTGTATAYLVATAATVQQQAFQIIGPPLGHPDYNANFSPYTAYAETQDTIVFMATLTVPDNVVNVEIARVALSAGQTQITASNVSTAYQVIAAPMGGTRVVQGNETISGTLVVGGATALDDTLAVVGDVTFDENLDVKGNESIGGTLDVSGAVTLNETLSVGGDETVGGTLAVAGSGTTAPATTPTQTPQLGQLFVGSRKVAFTAGGTIKVPSFVTQLFASGCAAGGGGGSSYTDWSGGSGGGYGQWVLNSPITVTPGDVLTVAIGAGGAGGVTTSESVSTTTIYTTASGAAGTDTTITDSAGTVLLTLTGGGGGSSPSTNGQSSVTVPGPGGVGYPYGGSGNYAGGSSCGGAGASGPFGGGGCAVLQNETGLVQAQLNAYGYGAGGAGGADLTPSGALNIGGNGAPGYLVLEW